MKGINTVFNMNKLEDNQTNRPALFGTAKIGINMGKEMLIRLKKFLISAILIMLLFINNQTILCQYAG